MNFWKVYTTVQCQCQKKKAAREITLQQRGSFWAPQSDFTRLFHLKHILLVQFYLHRINPSQSLQEDWQQLSSFSESYEMTRNSLWSLQGLCCRLQGEDAPVDSPQNCMNSSCIPSPGSPVPQRLLEGTVDGCFPTKACAVSLKDRPPQADSPANWRVIAAFPVSPDAECWRGLCLFCCHSHPERWGSSAGRGLQAARWGCCWPGGGCAAFEVPPFLGAASSSCCCSEWASPSDSKCQFRRGFSSSCWSPHRGRWGSSGGWSLGGEAPSGTSGSSLVLGSSQGPAAGPSQRPAQEPTPALCLRSWVSSSLHTWDHAL